RTAGTLIVSNYSRLSRTARNEGAIPTNMSTAMTEEESASTRNNVEEIHGQLFEVGPRYVNLSYIGEGAYGMVA
ncbi:hypothetical protein TELCIR_18589, partial [Teladorsagia circumcincta]